MFVVEEVGGRGGGGYSFATCLVILTADRAISFEADHRSYTPNRDTSSIWALIAFLSYIT